jgi:hypothetical protein
MQPAPATTTGITNAPTNPTPLTAELREGISPVWDMSQERVFMETILNQRFQFFLLIFSAAIAGSLNAKYPAHLKVVLCVGSTVCWLFALLLFHSQRKVDVVLDEHIFANPEHPAKIINDDCKRLPFSKNRFWDFFGCQVLRIRGSKRKYVGYYIPFVCCSLLTIGAVLSLVGIISVPDIKK